MLTLDKRHDSNLRMPSLFFFHRATDFFACGVAATNLFRRAAVVEPKSSSDLFVCKTHLINLRAISINGWKYKADVAQIATTQRGEQRPSLAVIFAPSWPITKSAAGFFVLRQSERREIKSVTPQWKTSLYMKDTLDGGTWDVAQGYVAQGYVSAKVKRCNRLVL